MVNHFRNKLTQNWERQSELLQGTQKIKMKEKMRKEAISKHPWPISSITLFPQFVLRFPGVFNLKNKFWLTYTLHKEMYTNLK